MKSKSQRGKFGEWISVDDGLPDFGEAVILYANGVVQEVSVCLSDGDFIGGPNEYCWYSELFDYSPPIRPGQMWMRWPEAPKKSPDEPGEER